jgi:oxygen-independent coproporphyrinogen-3 oxidase
MFDGFPPETLYAYPVPEITETEAAMEAVLSRLPFVSSGGPTALYVHVPFCSSICEFCGFIRSADLRHHVVDQFCEDLLQEIDTGVATLGLRNERVHALFFGGGTASILSAAQVDRILTALATDFSIATDAETTFEGECLSLLKPGFLEAIASNGFRRLSFGVQIMDSSARQVLNLKPTREQLSRLSDLAAGFFPEVCVDYIYGWPLQTPEALRRDVDCLIQEVHPSSIELFQFEKLDASPAFLQGLYSAGCCDPTTAELQQLRSAALEQCAAHGYHPRSYTRLTLSPDESTVSYSSCYYGWSNGNVLGFGRGAQSFFNGVMWGNGLTATEYSARVQAGFPPVADFAAFEINERESVTWPRRGWIRQSTLQPWCLVRVAALERAGLVETRDGSVRLTPLGEQWVPSIMHYLMPPRQRRKAEAMSASRLATRHAVSCA